MLCEHATISTVIGGSGKEVADRVALAKVLMAKLSLAKSLKNGRYEPPQDKGKQQLSSFRCPDFLCVLDRKS